MTKKSKLIKLITLVIVLLAVLTAYFVVEKINKDKQEKELIESTSEETDSITMSSIDTTKVASFSYLYDKAEFEFKKENDTWYCANDESKELDQDKVNELVANFGNVTVSRVVEDLATDLAQYGLDNPTNIIKVTEIDGNITTYQIGNINDVTGGYYIKTEDNNTVYLINAFPAEFTKSLDDLIKTQEDITSDATTGTDSSITTDLTDTTTGTDSTTTTESTDTTSQE